MLWAGINLPLDSYSWDKSRPNVILQLHLQLSDSWESDQMLSGSSCFSTTEMGSLTPDVQKKTEQRNDKWAGRQRHGSNPIQLFDLPSRINFSFLSAAFASHHHPVLLDFTAVIGSTHWINKWSGLLWGLKEYQTLLDMKMIDLTPPLLMCLKCLLTFDVTTG